MDEATSFKRSGSVEGIPISRLTYSTACTRFTPNDSATTLAPYVLPLLLARS